MKYIFGLLIFFFNNKKNDYYTQISNKYDGYDMRYINEYSLNNTFLENMNLTEITENNRNGMNVSRYFLEFTKENTNKNYSLFSEINEGKNYKIIFNKYNLYKILKNKKVNINTKLKLIEDNMNEKIIKGNITKGGLYKDWNFFI